MSFRLIAQAQRCTTHTLLKTSSQQALRWYAAVPVTHVQTIDNDWEGSSTKGSSGGVSHPTAKDGLQERPTSMGEGSSKHTSWQRRILSLNKPQEVVSEGGRKGILISGEPYELDDESNLSSGILPHIDRKLYLSENHPLGIIRNLIESTFQGPTYRNYVHVNPVVTTGLNFDVLGFPADHPGRRKTDTYYVNQNHVLRTHTSAHEDESFRKIGQAGQDGNKKHEGFTLIADVYRRDSVDRSHYPVFHQMEGARTWKASRQDSNARVFDIRTDLESLGSAGGLEVTDCPSFTASNPIQDHSHTEEEADLVARHLKRSLEHLVVKVITTARQARLESDSAVAEEPIRARWIEAYFPFTSPSFELEVWWKGEWLELLGCGVTTQSILDNAGIPDRMGWAWGIGLERLAMLLFGIPDIRLFWSEDPRFLNQFRKDTITEFKPFSRFPTCFKDVAFWIDPAKSTTAGVSHTPSSSEVVNKGPAVAAPAGGHPSPPSNDPSPPSSDMFHENDLMEIVRDVAGPLVEDVQLVDTFTHPKSGRRSLCYRINYRSLERTLTNEETNDLHRQVTARVENLGVELR